jgi:hypothetical protein
MTDFELAVRSALPRVFTHEFEHLGDYFHFAQAIMKRVKLLGMLTDGPDSYGNDLLLNEYIRKIKVMALVPRQALSACLTYLLDLQLGYFY